MKIDSYEELRDLVLKNDDFGCPTEKRLLKVWNNSEDFSPARALVSAIIKMKETRYKIPAKLNMKLREFEGKKRGRGFEKKEPRNWLQS